MECQGILPVEGEVSDSDPESETEGPADGEACSEGERLKLPKDIQFMRRILDPREPTENEIKEHQEMNHAVYRNWCPICVRASGKEMPHKKCGDKTREVPVYEFDYCFPGDEMVFTGQF